jgi:histidinol-phosphate aminotransferase
VRIGYGFAHEDLISNLLKVKLPFEPSAPAQAAGIAALADREFLKQSLALNARGLRFLTGALGQMGFTVAPSDANFVMIILESDACAKRIFEQLLARGIIVRPLGAFGLPQCLRISTGLDEHNQRLADAFAALRTEMTT